MARLVARKPGETSDASELDGCMADAASEQPPVTRVPLIETKALRMPGQVSAIKSRSKSAMLENPTVGATDVIQ